MKMKYTVKNNKVIFEDNGNEATYTIEEFTDDADFEEISKELSFDLDFAITFKDWIYWEDVDYHKLSIREDVEEFIKKLGDYFCWCKAKQYIKVENKYILKFDDGKNKSFIYKNKTYTLDEFKEFMEEDVSDNLLISNEDRLTDCGVLTIEAYLAILKYVDKDFKLDDASNQLINVTINKIIQYYPQIKSHKIPLPKNKKITMYEKFVKG